VKAFRRLHAVLSWNSRWDGFRHCWITSGSKRSADDPAFVSLQDQRIRPVERQLGAAVQLDPASFVLAELLEARDRSRDRFPEAGLPVPGVLSGDDHIGAKREIVANEHVLAAAEADRQRLVDAVATADRQRDAWCDLGLQLQGAEEAGVIRT
jgi:hypothetical protein